jgi:hypothetical protein
MHPGELGHHKGKVIWVWRVFSLEGNTEKRKGRVAEVDMTTG